MDLKALDFDRFMVDNLKPPIDALNITCSYTVTGTVAFLHALVYDQNSLNIERLIFYLMFEPAN